MSRLYALTLIALSILSIIAYVYYGPTLSSGIVSSPYKAPKESKLITATWEDFLKDCGGEVIVENFVHARSIFNRKYESNIVEWTGHFVDIK